MLTSRWAAPVFQTALRVLYPSQCLLCDELVTEDTGLCGSCFKDLPLISGAACDACGVPLPGEADGTSLCDDCLSVARPWSQGRAVFRYAGTGRKLVLVFKHADRTDLAKPAAAWMARRIAGITTPETCVVPVPLHWRRRMKRRYNQSTLLARALCRQTGLSFQPEWLVREVATQPLDGLNREQRFDVLRDTIRVPRQKTTAVAGKRVLVVDDVMTSGATLAACAEALQEAGAEDVNVAVLARVVKDA